MTAHAEDCNAIPTANVNRAATFKSTSTGSAPESSGEEKSKRHSFSRKLAREIQKKKGDNAGHGAHEATVLKYLAHRARTTKRKDGRKGFYLTLRDLGSVFPYLSKSSIADIVHRLHSFGYIEMWNGNRHRYDRTFWYDVPENHRDAAEQDIIYFDCALAVVFKVPAAVLLDNLEYWWKQCRVNGEKEEVVMSPATLSDLLPFSVDTIKRGLATLIHHGRAIKCSKTLPMYSFVPLTSGANPEMNGADLDSIGADLDKDGADLDTISADLDNDTSYITINKLLENPLETHSKQKPSASCSECSYCDGQTNKGIDISTTTHSASRQEEKADSSKEKRFDSGPDVADEVFDVAATTVSLHALRTMTRSVCQSLKDCDDDIRTMTVDKTQVIARSFFTTLGDEQVYIHYGLGNHDELVQVLGRQLISHFNKRYSGLDLTKWVGMALFVYTLECVVGGFLYKKDVLQQYGYYGHGNSALQSYTYEVHIKVLDVIQTEQVKQDEEWMDTRRTELASRDGEKENDADLAPAEKVRVLRSGVHARNKVGWICWDHEHRQNLLTVSKAAWGRAEKLFKQNPHLSPSDVLQVVDQAMHEFTRRPAPRKHEGTDYWHFKQFSDLCHMMNALDQVVVRLGISHELPSIEFLKDVTPDEPADVAA